MIASLDMTVRFRLRELLEDRGISQSELARQSGVSFVTINRMCANVTEGLTLKTLDALVRTLKVEPGEIFEAVPDKRKSRG
jgi:putative transcriptional regulator